MKVTQLIYKNRELIVNGKDEIENPLKANLVLGFGAKGLVDDIEIYNELSNKYPSAEIALCSTAGEISGRLVHDNSIVITVIAFEKTTIKTASLNLKSHTESFEAGKTLVQKFDKVNLAHILILSDGLIANGSQLVRGIEAGNDGNILITGGLAADSTNFESTLVGLNTTPIIGEIAAIGFYGNQIDIRSSSVSGWDVFGPERTITKASGSNVYEIDNRSAIELYKIYLGPYIDDRTSSTLLFPISVKLPGNSHPLVRSILSINYEENCMVFSGDVPEGSMIRFMKSSFDKIIDAAAIAAKHIDKNDDNYSPELALLISCVGRRNVLDKQIEQEVEKVADHFTDKTAITGFYSYGEISPQYNTGPCELHNQTMTITTFKEL